MSGKNKFGFEPLETKSLTPRRSRTPGPMGTAVRDVAETVNEATEAKVQQRLQNAEDAKLLRKARAEGRVLVQLPLSDIRTDDLPRDRLDLEAVAASDEMEELKASIRERGQKEPIEVYEGKDGSYQLKKGWRRFTALGQLHAEFGDPLFSVVTARIEVGEADRMTRYVDMVEENVVREDLSFAEMAQVAIAAANDPSTDESDPAQMVNRLYASLHKTKRSYIRNFVFVLSVLGYDLKYPKHIGRNLGVDVARAIKSEDQISDLRHGLSVCGSPEEQAKLLTDFLQSQTKRKGQGRAIDKVSPAKQKFEFFVGKTKVTARDGECRIVSDKDFANIRKDVLEEAIKAFEDAVNRPRAK